MRRFFLSLSTIELVLLFGLGNVVFGLFVFVLTLAGWFVFPILALGFSLIVSILTLTLVRFLRATRWPLHLFIITIAIFSISIGTHISPSVFSGRDQGSIAEAAWRLAANGTIPFHTPTSDTFFKLHTAGSALNFPGFAYTQGGALITQFPLGYIAYLGSFVSLFGISGYAIANSWLLFLSLSFFAFLLGLFVNRFFVLGGTIIFALSLIPSWLVKYTLTENLALFLFLFLAGSIGSLRRHPTMFSYLSVITAAALFAFTRIEGWVFLSIALIFLVLSPMTRSFWRTRRYPSIIFPIGIFLFLTLDSLLVNFPFYKTIAKALFRFFPANELLSPPSNDTLPALWTVFFSYGLGPIFITGLFGIGILIWKRRWPLLIPAILAAPTFLYLIQPSITPDHPWMFRRFLFTIFPTLVFTIVVTLDILITETNRFSKNVKSSLIALVFVFLIGAELPAFIRLFPGNDDSALLQQTAEFANRFSDHDLILIDRLATGDPFTMISGPLGFLAHKNAAYIFDPNDLGRLDRSAFDHTYLLVPASNRTLWETSLLSTNIRLKEKTPITFTTTHYEALPLLIPTIPTYEVTTTDDLLFEVTK